MILHTIIPVEKVFENIENADKYLKEIIYEGERLEVIPLSDDSYCVQRIISTDPQSFFNEKLQPGSIIKAT